MANGVIGEVDILVGADAAPFQRAIDKLSNTLTKTVTNNLSKIAEATPRELGKMVQNVGSSMEKVGGKLTNYITKPIGGAVVAAGALTTALGFKRLVGIDTARGQFKGLGMDADAVMKQVDLGVTNTSLSMAQGASMAVGILATGAVPLQGLEAQIKRVANVSAAYNVDSEQAAYLLNNVLTKNKVTWGDLSQMQMNQIPIVSQLAEHYGVAGDEIMKMAQEGAISIEDLNEVIDKNAGMAALEYAKTWTGVTKNIVSNVGKIGAKLMEPSFEIVKAKAADFLTLLQSPAFAAWADKWGAIIGDLVAKFFEGISKMIEWWNNLSPAMQKTLGVLAGVAVAAGPVITIFGKITGAIGGLLGRFPALSNAVSATAGTFYRGLNGMTGATFSASGRFGLLINQSGGLLRVLGRVAGIAGLVITALVAMWQNSESFREGVKQLFEAVWSLVSVAFQGLMDIFQALTPLFEAGGGVIGKLAGILGDLLGGALQFIAPILEWLADLLGTVLTAAAEGLATGIQWLVDAFSQGGEGAGVLGGIFEWLGDVWAKVSQFLVEAWENIKTAAGETVQWFETYVGPVFEAVGDLMEAVFNRIMTDATALWEVLEPAFQALGIVWAALWEGIQAAWEIVGPPLMEYIQTTFEILGNILEGIWNNLVIVFETVWAVIKNVVETALTIISEVINLFTALINGDWGAAWEAIKGIAVAIWEGIRTHIEIMITSVWRIIENILNTLKNVWDTIWGGISGFVMTIWDGIVAFVTGAINTINNIIVTIINAISNAWNSTWSAIGNFFNDVWAKIKQAATNFSSGVRSTVSTLLSFIGNMPGEIMGFFSGIGSWLLDSGKALIQGFIDGIKTAFDWAKNAVSEGLSTIRSFFPFSPAKQGPFSGRGWVSYAGQSLGETFTKSTAEALGKGGRYVSDALGGIADQFSDMATNGIDATALGLDMADQLARGLQQGTSQVEAAAAALADAAQGEFDGKYGPSISGPGIITAADNLSEATRRQGSGGGPESGGGGGGITFNAPLLSVETMTVDSEDRVRELAQELWTRANRTDRAQGRINLGGVVR